MITGVRLTQLAQGEPLLGASWEYKTLTGKAAVAKRLDDLFYNAKYLGFNFIIDTVKPQINANGQLTFENNGIYGDIWTFRERMTKYRELCLGLGLQLLLEVEFPTSVTEDNVYQYAEFFLDQCVSEFDWIKWWQVMVTPESKDSNGNYKCSPDAYVKFMRYVYPKIKVYSSEIKIGGPGIFDSLVQYVDSREGWLAEAIGEKFGTGSAYTDIGDKGFLPYIDFFTIQGKQNTAGLSYTNFQHAMDVLREGIFNRIGKNDLPIFSTYQGWKANPEDDQALKQQGYYELREILNCLRADVVPFKNQLVDEYPDATVYNGGFDENKLHYGLLKWYLGDNGAKPAFNDYLFMLQQLNNFNEVDVTNEVMEANDKLDSLTLIKKEGTTTITATIIWPKTFDTETVVLKAVYNREYLLMNGERSVLDEPKQITLENSHFLIVFEKVQQLQIDIADLEKRIQRKLTYTEDTLANLVSLLPDSYNKEVTDVNFYKLLRSLSVEMADAKVTLDEIKEDLYLDTARKESIYNNFGVLVNLKKKADWDWEKYRRLVKGVTKSLLEGPTYKSIVEAIQLFTNFNVNITELYKAEDKIDQNILDGISPQFAFIVEIEKPLDVTGSQENVYSDTGYIVNIVKPAHTISLIVVTLSGKEDWKEEYKEKHGTYWKDMDSNEGALDRESGRDMTEGIFGWKHQSYIGQLKTRDLSVVSNAPLTNGGMFIGPRYVLHDEASSYTDYCASESKTNEVVEAISALLETNAIEKYDKAKAGISAFESTAEEAKFGFDFSNIIETNGGISRLKLLNKFKLAYATKLKDEALFEPEYFFSDRFVFKNTLRSLRFNKNMGFGGKFVDNPDKVVIFDFDLPELTFRKKIIKLSDGTEEIIDRLGTEISGVDLDLQLLYDTTTVTKEKREVLYEIGFFEDDIMPEDILEPMIKLNGPSYMSKRLGAIKPRTEYSIGIDSGEDFPIPEEQMFNLLQVNGNEFYRPYSLSEEIYHIHKRITTTVQVGQDYVMVHPNDLYLAGKDGLDSLSRVFVNGVLMPSWGYEDILSQFDTDRSQGVRFSEDVVYAGDIVSILYLNDRKIIIGDFPIDDTGAIHLEDYPEDSYYVYEKVNNGFEISLDGNNDTYQGALDIINSLICALFGDQYGQVFDVPEFEGGPNEDASTWMNATLETCEPNFMPHEDIELPARIEDISLGNIADHYLQEAKITVSDSPEFEGPEICENNIVADLAIIDDPAEFGMMPSEHYVPVGDESKIIDATANIIELPYSVKEDSPYHDYVPATYVDLYERPISDHSYNGAEIMDTWEKIIADSHIQGGEWLPSDKFIFRSSDPDAPSHDVIFSIFSDNIRTLSITDVSVKDCEFGDIRIKALVDTTVSNWTVAEIETLDKGKIGVVIDLSPSMEPDLHGLQSNIHSAFRFGNKSKFNSSRFFTKPVMDYEGYEMIPFEQIKVKNIGNQATILQNDVVEMKYAPKNSSHIAELQRDNSDRYSPLRRDENLTRECDQANDDQYRIKAAVVYMEMIKYINGRIPILIKNTSMT